ncbi:hypothetical protein [uncultured Flavobacterium sp.]|uniref:hypothetical protein n=1 Tax=uncultured Flavobacterium sp. TaxID=165435 RepID=UPI0025EE8E28|nr:hypothetical protein [uncultured Flavobacterium sp.]
MPIPQLNLSLGLTGNKTASSLAEEGQVIVRTDSALIKHTITIHITDEESGKVRIINPHLNNKHSETIELPTYKMLVTDSLTDEKHTYEVTRDFIIQENRQKNEKKSFWSFLNFDFIKPKNYSYNVLSYEPEFQEIESYIISKHRKLNHDLLSYYFSKNDKTISLFAGNYDDFVKPENQESLFIVVDGEKGQRFIGDILYREKFLKLTPLVELKIIKRKKSPKSVEFDKKGNISKIVYI